MLKKCFAFVGDEKDSRKRKDVRIEKNWVLGVIDLFFWIMEMATVSGSQKIRLNSLFNNP